MRKRKPPTSRPTRSRTSGPRRPKMLKEAKAAADAGKFDDAVKLAQRSGSARQRIDRAGQRARDGLEGRGHSLTGPLLARRLSCDHAPPRRAEAAYGRGIVGRGSPTWPRGRGRRALRHRPFRQCARAAHDRHACAAQSRAFPRTERQSRRRRHEPASRRIWSARPSSSISASRPSRAARTPSRLSISQKPRTNTAGSAALRISRR